MSWSKEDELIRRRIKTADLEAQAGYREELLASPKLESLFLELTDRCNLACLHCGSFCSSERACYLDFDLASKLLCEVAEDFDPSGIMICLTGGEPLLYPRFDELVEKINSLGFYWGMTSNGTLIDRECAERLKKLGMGSVSISIDGLKETHNAFRRAKSDNYKRTVEAVKNLTRVGFSVQVTTVVHKKNYSELSQMYDEMLKLGIYSWRVINIEPIGRALESGELMLDRKEFLGMLDFIREKRQMSGITGMDVCYGCSHYLSFGYERDVRDGCFMCGAGILVGAVLVNGDIYSCLDIERRPELVEGNIARNRFSEVWKNGFREYRRDRAELSDMCRKCEERKYCRADSMHTWDFESCRPRICIKNLEGEFL